MTTHEDLGAESRLRISPGVYVRAFGRELVVLDFGRGEYFGLDEVGAEIWRAIEAGQTLGGIADGLAERYDVSRETALTDVVTLATHMLGQGILDT